MNRSRCSYTCGGCGCGSCCNRCTQHSDRRHKKYAGHATTWILTETRRGAVGNMPPAGYSVRGNDRSAAATVPAVQDGCGACCSRCCNRTDDTNKTGHATTRDLSVTRRGGGGGTQCAPPRLGRTACLVGPPLPRSTVVESGTCRTMSDSPGNAPGEARSCSSPPVGSLVTPTYERDIQ